MNPEGQKGSEASNDGHQLELMGSHHGHLHDHRTFSILAWIHDQTHKELQQGQESELVI
jgi:hypothetical protein